MTSSPLGLHRVVDPVGVLPQAAWRLDPTPVIAPDEVLIRVDRLNLDAASYRQLREAHAGDPDKIRAAVLDIVATRGKMQNPVTGSGGMLTGTVEQVGPDSPLGLRPGQRIATLVSLTLTPLTITDALASWDAQSEQVPCQGHAILFARSIAAPLPADLTPELALAVMDVCGAPALTQRIVRACRTADVGTDEVSVARGPVVLVLGAAGKSGSLSAAAAREAGASKLIGVVPTETEAALLRSLRRDVALAPSIPLERADGAIGTLGAGHGGGSGAAGVAGTAEDTRGAGVAAEAVHPPLVDAVVVADARDPVRLAEAVAEAGGPADVTVVCVDAPGCEGGAILATAQGGTVIFFSMATSFSAAALGAEGIAADVTMLIGNGYVPGHAELALQLIRTNPAVRAVFERRVTQAVGGGRAPRN